MQHGKPAGFGAQHGAHHGADTTTATPDSFLPALGAFWAPDRRVSFTAAGSGRAAAGDSWISTEAIAGAAAARPELVDGAQTEISRQQTLPINTSAVALAVPQAQAAYLAETGKTLDGSGLRIGILSDSFNLHGEEAYAIAHGYLPAASNIHVIAEGPVGGGENDEGMAMAELVHAIAPGAQIYFYTAFNSETDFANGITTLAADGCNVIVDDVTYLDEPFFQDTGPVTQAVESVVAEGVDYFTAANNSANNFYEATFSPIANYNLPGIGTETVHNVGGGSPYEAITLTTNPTIDFTLEWTQPYGANAYDIGVGLYQKTNGTYSLVENFSTSALGGDPLLQGQDSYNLQAGTYYLAFYEGDSQTAGVTAGTFKIVFWQDTTGTIDGVGAGVGSGASIGHELVPGANTVAAVNVADTLAEGVATPVVESYSAAGPGETYIDASGDTLATPIDDGKPDFAATDGTATTIFNPFDGTSAAAPNAAAVALLMLQADSRLQTPQVTYLLERSAIPTASTITGGAGLIQANTAVAGAYLAATTPIWTAQDHSTLWSDPGNWSDNAVPGASGTVEITDGDGMFTGAYNVAFNEAAATVAALTVDGGIVTGARPTLTIGPGDVLTTGAVTLGGGTIAVAGTLVDAGALTDGSSAGTITVAATGMLSIAGATAATIDFSGGGGDVTFSATGSTLISGLDAIVQGFGPGDVLDLSHLAESGVYAVHVDGNAVTVVNAANQALAELDLSGAFVAIGFTADSTGGTELLACFAGGTRIATESGEVAVEDLQPGQLLRTADGGTMPLRWLGRSTVGGRRLDPLHELPVRVRAGALAPGLPRRDLLLSPGHALFIDGLLVNAGALVRGTSIVRERGVPHDFVYWHVELETHALVLAEGVATETFLADAERMAFDNWDVREPPPDVAELPYPRCKSARQLPAYLRAAA